MKGVIKRLDEKGFGFITPEGETKDVFFHRNDLKGISFDSLQEGQMVSFEKEAAEKGPKAVNIELVGTGDEDTEIETTTDELVETEDNEEERSIGIDFKWRYSKP